MYQAFRMLNSPSSKSKPIAPKMKFSATLGPASAAEVLKQINTFESNTIGTSMRNSSDSVVSQSKQPSVGGSMSSVGSNSAASCIINNNDNNTGKKEESGFLSPTEKKTISSPSSGSIARIIKSDSLQNLSNRLLPSLASNILSSAYVPQQPNQRPSMNQNR
jgi:hypothetical protein